MPRIPTYVSTAELVLPPMVEVTSPLVPIGNALVQGGLLVAKRAAELKEQQDKADALAAYTRFSDEERQYLQSGFAKQGVDARGLTDEGIKWYEEAKRRHSEPLGPEARAYFERILVAKRDAGLDSLARHEATQHRQYLMDTAEALVQNMSREAVRFAADDPGFEQAWSTTEEGLRTLFPGKNVEAMILKAKRAAIQDRISTLIDTDPDRADQLMQRYKTEIDPDKMAAYTAHLERSKKAKRLDDAYTAIKAQFGRNLEAAIRALETPQFYKAFGLDVTQARELKNVLHSDWSFRKSQEAEARQRNREIAYATILAELASETADYGQIRKNILNMARGGKIDAKDAWSIIGSVEERARQQEREVNEKNKWLNYVGLTYEILNGEINDRAELADKAIRKGLPIESIRQLLSDFENAQKAEGAINYMEEAVKEATQYITQKAKGDIVKQQNFIGDFRHTLALNMQQNNLRRDRPEVLDLGRKLLQPFSKTESGTFVEPLRQPLLGSTGTRRTPIPVDVQIQIVQELAAKGAPLTWANVEAAYEQLSRLGM